MSRIYNVTVQLDAEGEQAREFLVEAETRRTRAAT